MKEINRQLFVTLNKERENGHIYTILNDQNFVCNFYADDDTKANLVFDAYINAGFREKFAIGCHEWIDFNPVGFNNCIMFTYGNDVEFQDANGALYNTKLRKWVN